MAVSGADTNAEHASAAAAELPPRGAAGNAHDPGELRDLFVGRAEDLAWIAARAASPGCRLVITGEAGIGKTSVIRRAASRLAPASGVDNPSPGVLGAGMFEGGALATLRWVPYLALQQAMRNVVPRGSDTWSGDAEFVATVIEKNVGTGLLFVDDVHWADQATWSVLALLAGRVRMVAAVRHGDPEAENALERLDSAGFERLSLAPLSPDDALAVARHARGDLAEYQAASIVARAGGNPLVIEELAAGNVGSLRLAMAARLAALPPAAAADLELLAVAGRALDSSALSASPTLLAAGVVTEVDGGMAIRHALLAEIIGADIGDERLRDVHRRLAGIVTDPGSRARHLLDAGETQQAYAQAMIAVESASTPGERAAHLATAAACASPEQEPGLLLRAARAAADAGEFQAAGDMLDRIARVNLDVIMMRAYVFSQQGDGEGWLRELDRAQGVLDEQQNPGDRPGRVEADSRVTLLAERARATLLASGDPQAAIAQAREAVAQADRHGVRQGLAHYVLGSALHYVADPDCITELEAARGFARREGDLDIELRASNNFIVAHEGGGNPALGRAAAEEMARYAEGLKLLRWQRHFVAAAMNIAVHQGDLHTVVDSAPEILAGQMMRRTREQLASSYGLALIHLGRIDECLQIAEAQLADSEITRSNFVQFRAMAATYRGDDEGVLAEWPAFVNAVENNHRMAFAAPTFVRAARNIAVQRATVDGGAYDASMPLDATLLPGLPDLAEACALPMLRAVPAEIAAICVEPVEPAQAAADYANAARLWRPYEREAELRCDWCRGAALAAAGERSAAINALSEVEQRAADHRMTPLLALIRRSLRELGVWRGAIRAASALTMRQSEILELVAHGLTDAEIATRLGLSVRTVHSHIASARRALGAANRRHAALLAAELRAG